MIGFRHVDERFLSQRSGFYPFLIDDTEFTVDNYHELNSLLQEAAVTTRVCRLVRHLYRHHPELAGKAMGEHRVEMIDTQGETQFISLDVTALHEAIEKQARSLSRQNVLFWFYSAIQNLCLQRGGSIFHEFSSFDKYGEHVFSVEHLKKIEKKILVEIAWAKELRPLLCSVAQKALALSSEEKDEIKEILRRIELLLLNLPDESICRIGESQENGNTVQFYTEFQVENFLLPLLEKEMHAVFEKIFVEGFTPRQKKFVDRLVWLVDELFLVDLKIDKQVQFCAEIKHMYSGRLFDRVDFVVQKTLSERKKEENAVNNLILDFIRPSLITDLCQERLDGIRLEIILRSGSVVELIDWISNNVGMRARQVVFDLLAQNKIKQGEKVEALLAVFLVLERMKNNPSVSYLYKIIKKYFVKSDLFIPPQVETAFLLSGEDEEDRNERLGKVLQIDLYSKVCVRPWLDKRLDSNLDTIEQLQVEGARVGVCATRGFYQFLQTVKRYQNKERVMQDEYLVQSLCCGLKTICLIGVFDGHGKRGNGVARLVKDRITTRIQGYFSAFDASDWNDKKIEETLLTCCLEVEKKIKEDDRLLVSIGNPPLNGGTTMNLNVQIDDAIWCVNVGDSRSVLLTHDKKGLQLSQDASFQDLVFRQEFEERGGKIVHHLGADWANGRLAMATSFEGSSAEFQGVRAIPRITKTQFLPGSLLIVASDGLWADCPSSTVLSFASKIIEENTSESALAECLTELAIYRSLKKGYQRTDNITVVTARL